MARTGDRHFIRCILKRAIRPNLRLSRFHPDPGDYSFTDWLRKKEEIYQGGASRHHSFLGIQEEDDQILIY